VPQAAIKVVPAGVDTSRFCPHGPVADRAGRPRVLMFASLAERQLIATVLAALARVPDAELVIAGGPARSQLPNVPGYRDAIKLAQRLRLEHRLTLLGQLSQDNAPALMRSADVLVSLAADEPFAMTPVQAMACGIPVIATAAGAQRDAVIHGTTGLIVAPTDPELLAGRLRQLLAAPMQREGYGIAAASRAKARYSWDRIARETVAVYETLARTSAAAAAAA
jgi:glycosyltransferase involved in cell wall biosynthesis